MLETLVIYFLLVALWVESTFGAILPVARGVSLSNLAFILIFMGWLLNIACNRGDFRWNRLYLYIMGLVLVVAISIPCRFLNGEFKNVSLLEEIALFKGWLEPFILFVLVYNLARSKPIIKRTTFGLMVVLMLSVLVTLLVVTDVFVLDRVKIARGTNWPLFAEPNQYAAYIVLMFPLFFSYTVFGARGGKQVVSGVCCVLILIAFIAAGSRGGLLALCITALSYLLLLKRIGKTGKRGVITSGSVFILLVLISLVAVPKWLVERTTEKVEFKEEVGLNKYSSGRLDKWAEGLDLFMDRPILGLGQNAYHFVILEKTGHLRTDIHNNYLKYLVSHGAIGLLLFCLLIFGLLREGFKNVLTAIDNFGVILYLGFSCGLLGFCVAIFFVDIFWIWSLVMIYAAIVLRYALLDSEERSAVRALCKPVMENGLIKV